MEESVYGNVEICSSSFDGYRGTNETPSLTETDDPLSSVGENSHENSEENYINFNEMVMEIIPNKFLEQFIEYDNGNQQFCCSKCNYASNKKNDLKVHLLKMHYKLPKRFRCLQCDFDSHYRHAMKDHLVKHLDFHLLRCPSCNFMTRYENTLEEHILNHIRKGLLKCMLCDFKTTSINRFKYHKFKHFPIYMMHSVNNDVHSTNSFNDTVPKIYSSDKCSSKTGYQSSLQRHLPKRSKNTRKFKCDKCLYETTTKVCLKAHILNHSSKKAFRCAYCDYKTNWSNYMKTHLKIHERSLMINGK